MTTAELIAKLREIDPSGELEVIIEQRSRFGAAPVVEVEWVEQVLPTPPEPVHAVRIVA